jgi:plasmid stabilization system protein ParE
MNCAAESERPSPNRSQPARQHNRPKAPNAIRDELERIAALISFQPNIGPIARNVRLPGVRKIHIERIHCHIYYRVVGEPPYVEIVGFWGTRRGTDPPI